MSGPLRVIRPTPSHPAHEPSRSLRLIPLPRVIQASPSHPIQSESSSPTRVARRSHSVQSDHNAHNLRGDSRLHRAPPGCPGGAVPACRHLGHSQTPSQSTLLPACLPAPRPQPAPDLPRPPQQQRSNGAGPALEGVGSAGRNGVVDGRRDGGMYIKSRDAERGRRHPPRPQ